jgi:hypothetical protein
MIQSSPTARFTLLVSIWISVIVAILDTRYTAQAYIEFYEISLWNWCSAHASIVQGQFDFALQGGNQPSSTGPYTTIQQARLKAEGRPKYRLVVRRQQKPEVLRSEPWLDRRLAQAHTENVLTRMNPGFLFHFSRLTLDRFPYDTRIRMPVWFLCILIAFSPMILIRMLKPLSRLLRHRQSQTQCSNCGYDCRASMRRCPECGSINPTVS